MPFCKITQEETGGKLTMKNKTLSLLTIFFFIFCAAMPSVYATGMKEATSSLLLPTTGQAMNNQMGSTKTKIMAGVEVASITTVALLGTLVGGGVVWAGLGPMLANHLWSATDAYKNAQYKNDPLVQQQMMDAQRTLDLSRQRRFDREESYRSDIRDRVLRAGEQATY